MVLIVEDSRLNRRRRHNGAGEPVRPMRGGSGDTGFLLRARGSGLWHDPSGNTDRGCLGTECGRLRLKHLIPAAVSIPCSVMFKIRGLTRHPSAHSSKGMVESAREKINQRAGDRAFSWSETDIQARSSTATRALFWRCNEFKAQSLAAGEEDRWSNRRGPIGGDQ